MNAKRRAEIAKFAASLENIKVSIETLRDEVDSVRSDEEDCRDNMPEGLQGGDRYIKATGAVDALQDAHDILDELVSELEGVASNFETASA